MEYEANAEANGSESGRYSSYGHCTIHSRNPKTWLATNGKQHVLPWRTTEYGRSIIIMAFKSIRGCRRKNISTDVCYGWGERRFSEVREFGSLKPPPQTDLEQNKIVTAWRIPWSKCTTGTMQNKVVCFRRIWVKELVIDKKNGWKNANSIVTSMRQLSYYGQPVPHIRKP